MRLGELSPVRSQLCQKWRCHCQDNDDFLSGHTALTENQNGYCTDSGARQRHAAWGFPSGTVFVNQIRHWLPKIKWFSPIILFCHYRRFAGHRMAVPTRYTSPIRRCIADEAFSPLFSPIAYLLRVPACSKVLLCRSLLRAWVAWRLFTLILSRIVSVCSRSSAA